MATKPLSIVLSALLISLPATGAWAETKSDPCLIYVEGPKWDPRVPVYHPDEVLLERSYLLTHDHSQAKYYLKIQHTDELQNYVFLASADLKMTFKGKNSTGENAWQTLKTDDTTIWFTCFASPDHCLASFLRAYKSAVDDFVETLPPCLGRS